MGIVIPFPTKQVLDNELAVQLWELVMAGQIGTPEFHRLDAEIGRRKEMAAPREATSGRPWR